MIVDFITEYTKLIVSNPSDISVKLETISDDFVQINIKANEADIGKLIGKNGNMINAIKTMANGCKAKDGISYKLQVVGN
jgi:predicted RNA-binding protein YlqC (UPF0109 family)